MQKKANSKRNLFKNKIFYFSIIKISCSSIATITSPLEVSSLINFKAPSLRASTTCLPFPINEVI